MKVLVIDVGGTNLKVSMGGKEPPLKIPSGKGLTAQAMAEKVREATRDWAYEAVSIGFPGPVVDGHPADEPKNLGPGGWVTFDFEKAFGKPVRVINDAAMQALGSYDGGRMLFLGLGTGLGSALVFEGVLAPLELAHLPYRKGTYEDYIGLRGFKKMGRKKWERHVENIVALLKQGLQADYVVLGGGQTKELKNLPEDTRLGSNANAIAGGLRLWNDAKHNREGSPFVVGPALRGGVKHGAGA